MRGKYVLHSFIEKLLEQHWSKLRPQHCSQKPYDQLREAYEAMDFRDNRMFFNNIAYKNGYLTSIHHQFITSPDNKMLVQKYPVLGNDMNLPPGVYLDINTEAITLYQFEQETGLKLSDFEKMGELILLAPIKELLTKKEWPPKRDKTKRSASTIIPPNGHPNRKKGK